MKKIIKEGEKHSQVNKFSISGKDYDNFASMSPEDKAKLAAGLQQADKYLNNPLISGLLKGITGLDAQQLKGKITNNLQSKPSTFSTTTSSTHQLESTEELTTQQKTSYLSSQKNISIQPGVKKDNGRTFIAFIAIIGLIGWLLYAYTDII